MAKTLSVSLSEKSIKTHQKNPAIYQLKDPSRPLYLRYSEDRARGSWLYVHYKNAQQIRRKIGRWPEVSCAALLKKMPEIEQQLLIDQTPKRLDSFESVGELIEWHQGRLALESGLSASRKQQLASLYRRHLKPALGVYKIRELTPRLIDEELILAMQASYKIATIRLAFQALKALTAKAFERALIAEDPLKTLVFKQFYAHRIEAKDCSLGRSEGLQLAARLTAELKALPENPIETPALRLTLLLIAFGTRIGETRLARFRDLDLGAGLWHIPKAHTKTRVAHALPITEAIKPYLLDWQHQGGDYLLGKAYSARDASRLIQSLSASQWSAHDLRKFARSRWQELGVDYFIAERLLNHSRSQLDSTYLHGAIQEQQRRALEDYHALLGL